jgi:septal ring factor EnvC (AmiA/AmiB activator)
MQASLRCIEGFTEINAKINALVDAQIRSEENLTRLEANVARTEANVARTDENLARTDENLTSSRQTSIVISETKTAPSSWI